MDAIGSNLHHREQVPIVMCDEVTGERESLFRHFVELIDEPRFVVGAEPAHIENVLTDNSCDLVLQGSGIGVDGIDARSEKPGHENAAYWLRRIRSRDAEQDRA